uniref:Uncharacterized protein n=1 Tax=Aegilops tauschii subsp. strangulata TaxID=200361 RepID=A0A453NP04_AEGTS
LAGPIATPHPNLLPGRRKAFLSPLSAASLAVCAAHVSWTALRCPALGEWEEREGAHGDPRVLAAWPGGTSHRGGPWERRVGFVRRERESESPAAGAGGAGGGWRRPHWPGSSSPSPRRPRGPPPSPPTV